MLEYLSKEKKAAQLRRSNYNSSSNNNNVIKKEKDNDKTSSNSSFARGGRGKTRGGRGWNSNRGNNQQNNHGGSRGGGYGGARGGGAGRGRGGKRANISTTCLLCEENHALPNCPRWLDEETDKRMLLGFCLSQRICTSCLHTGHWWKECPSEEDVLCPCGSSFHQYVCCQTADCIQRKNWKEISTGNNTITATSSSLVINGAKLGGAILPIQVISVPDQARGLNCMWDNCSQNSFIKERTAKRLQLRGKKISFVLVCTNGSRSNMTGQLYDVPIADTDGNVHEIQAIGIPNLSSTYSGFKVIDIKKKVKNIRICKSLSEEKLNRSSSAIDILIGSDLASLHPEKVVAVGELVILRSKFGSGWTVMGHSRHHVRFTDTYVGTRTNFSGVENLMMVPEILCNAAGTKDAQFLECISTESLGVNVVQKCKSCKIISENCKECKMLTKTTTYLEYLQDQQIEDSIEKIADAPGYVASYPYNKEINELLPNDDVCLKRAETFEKNLSKRPKDLDEVNKKIQEGFDIGVFRWLTDEELKDWSGLIHYLPMNIQYKDSESTPIRLTFDAGQPDKNNRSLNSCMGKGSNPIQHFGSVILQFRSAEKVAAGDISKMFNQIDVRDQDKHLRRFFMRPDGLGGQKPWKVAVPTCVNFGESAAPAVATKVKNRCADDYEEISKPVAEMIRRKCIMDDINLDCSYNEDINVTIKKAEDILKNGKFSFKKWIKSGDKEEKVLESDTLTKSLGIWWKTEKDLLVYRIKLNFSKKKRGRYLSPDTTVDTLSEDFPADLTKRLALKLTHSVFDPANILSPWLLKQRLAYRDILFYERENEYSDWDRALPEKFRDQWLQLTREMFSLETLEFPRSVVPRSYDPKIKPILVLFSDGSDLGQCCVAYLVWKLLDGTTHVSLVTSRTKIASMTKITTPQSELCAAQLQSRLRVWLLDELDIEVGSTVHLVDASIILGMITNVSLKFDAFTAPRVTEIQNSTKIEEWFWLGTLENPSDLGTRGKCSVEDLGPGKMWREGPSWLKEPRETWPLRSDFRKNQVPGLKKEFQILPTVTNLTELVAIHTELSKEEKSIEANVIISNSSNVETESKLQFDVTSFVDHTKYNCWFKLVLVTAQCLKFLYKSKKLPVPHQVDLIKEAKTAWLKSMMPETREMLKHTKLSGFIIHEKDGLIYATTRSKQENLNPDDIVILSPSHPLTKKILFSIHNISHRGVQHVVAKSRLFYWIPQASKTVKSIKDHCFVCREKDAEAMKQLMSPLPQLRLKSSPIWHHSMLDLFGPLECKDFVNQRSSRKTWAVIITCLTTRACWVYLAESYSTDHLLTVLKKHEARNGSPAQYFADLGRQIVGADRVISEAIDKIDKKQVEDFATKRNVKFNFGTAHFPEGQGAVERLISEVKKSLKVISKQKHLSFGDMDCLMAEASYLVNSRPLQYNPTAGEDGFISPNDVMFGRSDMLPPDIEIDDNSLTRRAAHKQRIIQEFWEKWSSSYLQSLSKYSKWQSKYRNAKPGDVVMILDKELSKGKFKFKVIDSVKTDPDQRVRKVVVKYKLQSKKTKTSLTNHPKVYKYAERNIRGLALLIKAEERPEEENVDIDQIRFRRNAPDDEEENNKNSSEEKEKEDDSENQEVEVDADEEEKTEQNEVTDSDEGEKEDAVQTIDDEVEAENDVQKEDPRADRILEPTSSGRTRYRPKKFT